MADLPLRRGKTRKRKYTKKRGLLAADLRNEQVSSNRLHALEMYARLERSSNDVQHITNCINQPLICGTEAACRNFENSTSRCVCPHDLSPPTRDLKCPNRVTVPLTPKPIHNIIPPNANNTNSTTTLPDAEQVEQAIEKVPEIVAIVVGCILLLSVITGVLCRYGCRYFRPKTKRSTSNASPINLKKSLLLTNKYTPNPQYFASVSLTIPLLQKESVSFIEDIGEGCFGKVYKGEYRVNENMEIVAVKVLKETASREAEEDFMREVDIMSSFKHKNILTLIGVVLDKSNHPCMVFEYMPYGDLTQVLRNNHSTQRNAISGLKPLTKESLLWISTQIAAGMTYLSTQRFVHRDLACRNCLVGHDLIVKIADFGMSRDVYTCDYYKIGGSRLLPVRWMSPESVMYGRFTLESDVWSFGIVLWEIYTYGKQPYYGHNNDEVVKLILQGVILIPPEDCPLYITEVMRDCWKTEPRERLKFCDILEKLEKAQEKSSLIESLPKPPEGPIRIRTPNTLDSAGYLLPSNPSPCEYMQPLPVIHN